MFAPYQVYDTRYQQVIMSCLGGGLRGRGLITHILIESSSPKSYLELHELFLIVLCFIFSFINFLHTYLFTDHNFSLNYFYLHLPSSTINFFLFFFSLLLLHLLIVNNFFLFKKCFCYLILMIPICFPAVETCKSLLQRSHNWK